MEDSTADERSVHVQLVQLTLTVLVMIICTALVFQFAVYLQKCMLQSSSPPPSVPQASAVPPLLQPVWVQSARPTPVAGQTVFAEGFTDGRVLWVREDLVHNIDALQDSSVNEDVLRQPAFIPVGFIGPPVATPVLALQSEPAPTEGVTRESRSPAPTGGDSRRSCSPAPQRAAPTADLARPTSGSVASADTSMELKFSLWWYAESKRLIWGQLMAYVVVVATLRVACEALHRLCLLSLMPVMSRAVITLCLSFAKLELEREHRLSNVWVSLLSPACFVPFIFGDEILPTSLFVDVDSGSLSAACTAFSIAIVPMRFFASSIVSCRSATSPQPVSCSSPAALL